MVASDRQVMYWAPDKKTAVALKCLSTHSAVVQSFTSDTARAVAVYRSSGHAISQLLSRNKSVVSAHAQVARSVASGGHSHSCGICTHVLIDLFDTAQAIGMYAFYRSCHISFSVTKDVCCKPLNFFFF